MKVIVFGGPAIRRAEVAEILDAEYLAPPEHSDLISVARNSHPDVIVLLDGQLGRQQTVWHYEIIEALNLGVRVYGASGLGAIRAAELGAFGMIGIGRIFEQYRDRVLEADEEVFQRCEKRGEDYIPLSLPLVNLRASFARAESAGLISARERQELLEACRGVYYEDRTPENLVAGLRESGADGHCLEALAKILSEGYIDQKKEDALETLRMVSRLRPEELGRASAGNRYDLFFHAMKDRDSKVPGATIDIPQYILSNYVSLRHPQMDEVNANALNREISLLFAEVMRVEPSEEEVARERARFKKRFGLFEDAAFGEWLKNNDLDEEEFGTLMIEQAKIRKVQAWYAIRLGFAKNTRYLLNALKLGGAYCEWKTKCEDFHQEVLRFYPEIIERLEDENAESLLRRFQRSEGRSWNLPAGLFAEEILMSADTMELELAKDAVVKQKLIAEMRELFAGR